MALLQALSIPFFLYLVFLASGYQAMLDEAIISSAAGLALLCAIPALLVVNALRAAFRVKREEAKLGQWFGTCFVFHEPQLLLAARVTSADNGTVKPFKTKEAERDGSVELKIVLDGFEQRRVKATVFPDLQFGPPPWKHMTHTHTYTLAFTPKNKTFYLATHCETTNPSIVKVYLVSWNVV